MGYCQHTEGVTCPNCRDLRLFGDTSAVRYTDDTRLEALESRVAQLEAEANVCVCDGTGKACKRTGCAVHMGGPCPACPCQLEASARPGTRPGAEKSMDEPIGQPVSDRPDNPAALVAKIDAEDIFAHSVWDAVARPGGTPSKAVPLVRKRDARIRREALEEVAKLVEEHSCFPANSFLAASLASDIRKLAEREG